jgi:heme/copper-type cytochrome/quinol oxidase subunit 1
MLIHYRPLGIPLLYIDLYLYALLNVSLLLLLSLPFLTGSLFMIVSDINLSTLFYSCLVGGDPILYQHLFWFFGHPEVYILIVPGFSIVSFCIRSYPFFIPIAIFGNQCMCLSILCIGFFGFLVWSHHLYSSGSSRDCRMFFSLSTFLIAIPTTSKLLSWYTSHSPS